MILATGHLPSPTGTLRLVPDFASRRIVLLDTGTGQPWHHLDGDTADTVLAHCDHGARLARVTYNGDTTVHLAPTT